MFVWPMVDGGKPLIILSVLFGGNDTLQLYGNEFISLV